METRTKVWITEDGKPVIGEGKVALLRAIDEEGSLRKACSKVGVSYKHAWLVLNKMSERLGEDVVVTVRGGKTQGTFLTDAGRRLIKEYDMSKQLLNDTMHDETFMEDLGLHLSARNRIPAKVIEVEKGDIASRVKLSIEAAMLSSLITTEAVEKLNIKEGDEVFAVIKSTEVLIGKKAVKKD
ncbi:MAG: DNA-binding transcriptional regulator ModE [Methanomethylovorans sp. PtaU1.Bin093]|uniref:molybdenum-dependent transcriptional regulator n=1 Tax=Methanomethylovorans sp. PtaU1.Bin093 TaxID=1811679 RepID=UPI0009CE1B7B|nr:molybdenum-dependent transcriptional regulator [Methanomethylovorans sp. PtaU1.Bin093]OPY21811.1 MAG: DNA-binding transcriptional regulator ModE [Methanomethylovorans sp. PtaU1.Bin093]